jgi:hypothetical protein
VVAHCLGYERVEPAIDIIIAPTVLDAFRFVLKYNAVKVDMLYRCGIHG